MVGRKIQISGTLDFSEKKHILIPGLKKFFSFISLVWKIIVTSILWLEEKFKFLKLSISLRRNTLWINSWFEEILFIYLSGLKDYRYINFMVGRKIQISQFPWRKKEKEKEEDNLRYLKNLNLN